MKVYFLSVSYRLTVFELFTTQVDITHIKKYIRTAWYLTIVPLIMTHTAWSVLQFLYFKTNCLINTIANLGNYNLWYFSVNICMWLPNMMIPCIAFYLTAKEFIYFAILIKKRKSRYKLDTRITCFWYTRNIPDTANLNQALDCWELHVCVYSSNREMERIWLQFAIVTRVLIHALSPFLLSKINTLFRRRFLVCYI
jgi:hypothetical protein